MSHAFVQELGACILTHSSHQLSAGMVLLSSELLRAVPGISSYSVEQPLVIHQL